MHYCGLFTHLHPVVSSCKCTHKFIKLRPLNHEVNVTSFWSLLVTKHISYKLHLNLIDDIIVKVYKNCVCVHLLVLFLGRDADES